MGKSDSDYEDSLYVNKDFLCEGETRGGETSPLFSIIQKYVYFFSFVSINFPFPLPWFVAYKVEGLRRKFETCLWVVLVQILLIIQGTQI